MNHEERNERSQAYLRFRGSLHLGMGVVYIIIGILVLYIKHFGAIELESGIAYTLGGAAVLYGIFRLWRGFVLLRKHKGR